MLKDDERNGKRYTTSQRQRISYGRYGDYRQRRFEEGGKYHLPRKHCIQHRDRSSSRNDSSRRYHDSKRRLRNQDRFTRQKRKYRERSSSRSLKYDHKRDRDRSRSPSSTGKKISIATNNTFTTTDCSPPIKRHGQFSDLPLEWWERDEDCKLAKEYHQDKIDRLWPSREDLVMQTTLAEEDTVLEPNMFPYATPKGIAHYTLWSYDDLSHSQIVDFVDSWLLERFPQVRRWQYDDNSGERSILLFHVHVFIEMDPFSFTPRPDMEYFPPHMV